jgi:hypothetical protein
MEITSKLDMWVQCRLRMRLGDGGLPAGSPDSQRATS